MNSVAAPHGEATTAARLRAEVAGVRTTPQAPKTGRPRRVRKARLRMSRVDPWSVMKTAFMFSIAAGILLLAAAYTVWSVLASSGMFASINILVSSVISTPGDSTPFRLEDYVNGVIGEPMALMCYAFMGRADRTHGVTFPLTNEARVKQFEGLLRRIVELKTVLREQHNRELGQIKLLEQLAFDIVREMEAAIHRRDRTALVQANEGSTAKKECGRVRLRAHCPGGLRQGGAGVASRTP